MIQNVKNIGPTIANRLSEIGIHTLADLAQVTPVTAYKSIEKNYPSNHLPLCYYLYSLEGALQNVHWDELAKEEKEHLKSQVKANR